MCTTCRGSGSRPAGALNHYLAPDKGAEYCDHRVCVCLCVCLCLSVREHIFRRPICSQFFVHATYGRGLVLLLRRRDKLCTSGFMDDIILAHKPRQLNVAAQLIEAHGPGYKRRVGIPVAGQWTHCRSRNRIWCILALKYDIWWQQF